MEMCQTYANQNYTFDITDSLTPDWDERMLVRTSNHMIAINLTMRLPDEESVEAMLKKLHRRRKQISIKSPYYVEIKSSTLDASAIKVRKVTKRFTLMAIAVWGNELPDRPHEPEIEYELKARLIAFPWDVIYQGESVEDKMAYMNPEWGYL